MSVRKRPDGRNIWPWWRRLPFRFGRFLFNFFIGPFLTKFPDGTVQASMTRIAVAIFTVVEAYRLLPQPGPGEMRLVPVIGWPDAFLAFCILFALAIDKAMTTLAEKNPEKLVTALLGRMGIGDVAQSVLPPYMLNVDNRFKDDERDDA